MFPEASKKDQDKYIEIMQNEIKRSLTIINDFSSLGKIKNIEVEEIDICYLLEEIKDILEPLFKKNKAKIISMKNKKGFYYLADQTIAVVGFF